jgi:hypothetical protein
MSTRSLSQRKAAFCGVVPTQVVGAEDRGLTFVVEDGSDSVGAQCGRCNTVVWTDSLADPVLNEVRPNDVPSSGPVYRSYWQRKIQMFLASIPGCPICGAHEYDNFISNIDIARFQDGTSVVPNEETRLAKLREQPMEIWWYG